MITLSPTRPASRIASPLTIQPGWAASSSMLTATAPMVLECGHTMRWAHRASSAALSPASAWVTRCVFKYGFRLILVLLCREVCLIVEGVRGYRSGSILVLASRAARVLGGRSGTTVTASSSAS